jgi:hypothetical protein
LNETTIENFDKPEAQIHPALLLGIGAVALGSAFASVVAFWLYHPLLQYPDQSMYLATAGLMLDGKKLYVDMVDFNPPLITYLNILPVMLARAVHIPTTMAFSLYLFALIMVSTVVSGYLMFKDRKSEDAYFYLPFLLGFLFLCKQEVLDFGQREYLLIITYLPFFVVRYLRWRGVKIPRWIAVFSGLYAATTLALKPQFLLMAAAPELVYFIQKRRWKEFFTPETISCAALGIAYGVHLLFLDPAVKDRFYNFVVPLVKTGYDYYTVSFLKTISDFSRPFLYQVIVAIVLALPLSRYCSLIAPTTAFTVASLAIYLVASQEWSHHWVPVEFGKLTLFWLEIAVVARYLCSYSVTSKQLNLYMSGVLVALGIALHTLQNLPQAPLDQKNFDMTKIGYTGVSPDEDIQPWANIVLKYSKKGDHILFISDAIAPGYPVTLQMERRPASRYLHGMPLMMAKYLAFEKHRVDDRMKFEAFYQQIIDQYYEDIQKNKPTLIIVRNSGIMEPLQKGAFFGTHLENYKQVEKVDEHFIYIRK